MTCKDYKYLIEKFMMKEISKTELNQLELHLSGCKKCKKEFDAVQKMQKIVRKIKGTDLQFNRKEEVINKTLQLIGDDVEKGSIVFSFLLTKKFRLALSSVAAGILIFFSVQQFYLFSSLQNLELQNSDIVEKNYSEIVVKAVLLSKYTNAHVLKGEISKLNPIRLVKFIQDNDLFKSEAFKMFRLKSIVSSVATDKPGKPDFLHKKDTLF